MKILFTFRSRFPHVGGLAFYIKQLQKEFERRGHTVDILALHPAGRKYYFANDGREVHFDEVDPGIEGMVRIFFNKHPKLQHLQPWINSWREMDRYRLERTAQLLGIDHYDLIHAQCPVSAKAMWRVKPPHIPLIHTYHSSFPFENCISMGKGFRETTTWGVCSLIESQGIDCSDMTIFPSDWLRKLVILNHPDLPHEKLKVIRNGLDLVEFEQKLKEPCDMPVIGSAKVILCTSRLVYLKGCHVLLKALSKLSRVQTNWVCWIAGDGEEHESLLRLRKKLDLEKQVIFLGNRQDVPSLLKRADLFVLPSLVDNLPYGVMEAQLAGTPVVATNAGGVSEIVEHGKTGLLSPAGDSKKLYQNLKSVLGDASLRDRLSRQAHDWATKQWSAQRMADQILELYQEVIKTKDRKTAAPEYTIPDLTTVNGLRKIVGK